MPMAPAACRSERSARFRDLASSCPKSSGIRPLAFHGAWPGWCFPRRLGTFIVGSSRRCHFSIRPPGPTDVPAMGTAPFRERLAVECLAVCIWPRPSARQHPVMQTRVAITVNVDALTQDNRHRQPLTWRWWSNDSMLDYGKGTHGIHDAHLRHCTSILRASVSTRSATRSTVGRQPELSPCGGFHLISSLNRTNPGSSHPIELA